MQEKDEKYIALYKMQDKIIDIVAKEKLGFYLTVMILWQILEI